MQPFPNPSDITQNLIKIGQLASEIFKFESVDDDDGRWLTIGILQAFSEVRLAWIKNPGKVRSLVRSRQVKFAELYDAQLTSAQYTSFCQ